MGGNQLGFYGNEQTSGKNQSERETFLAEMEAIVPWDALIGLIEPKIPDKHEGWSASVLAGDDSADPSPPAVVLTPFSLASKTPVVCDDMNMRRVISSDLISFQRHGEVESNDY